MRNESLFTKRDLHHLLEHHKKTVQSKIEELDQNYLLKANEAELKQHFLEKYRIDPPKLLQDSIWVEEPSEIDINLSGNPRYDLGRGRAAGRRPTAKGTQVVIHVPFEGEGELFKWQPSTFSLSPPRARIEEHELLLVYEVSSSESVKLQQRYQREVSEIEQYLETARSQIDQCLRELPGVVDSAITTRKLRLQENMGVVGSLGLPVRRSGEQTVSVSLPKKRRPSPAPLPKVTPGPYQPEPTIDLIEYDHILEIVNNLTVAIERSPSAFAHMGEEQLRDHILVQLNGHYEGRATGETFNEGGKTDILVRIDDKNVFIGECKFWKGKKAFLETIDQLFGYTCWSDTKTAVVIFNRNRDHSKVLRTIQDQVSQHAKYKRDLEHRGENHFRYIFEHPGDSDRDMYVAILAINLPSSPTRQVGGRG